MSALNQKAKQPDHILIMCLDVATEYPILDNKLNDAVNATLATQEMHRVIGPLENLKIEKAEAALQQKTL